MPRSADTLAIEALAEFHAKSAVDQITRTLPHLAPERQHLTSSLKLIYMQGACDAIARLNDRPAMTPGLFR